MRSHWNPHHDKNFLICNQCYTIHLPATYGRHYNREAGWGVRIPLPPPPPHTHTLSTMTTPTPSPRTQLLHGRRVSEVNDYADARYFANVFVKVKKNWMKKEVKISKHCHVDALLCTVWYILKPECCHPLCMVSIQRRDL